MARDASPFPAFGLPNVPSPWTMAASTPLLHPWRAILTDAAAVVPMRLALLPMIWWRSPEAAEREVRTMFSEKTAAATEAAFELWTAPMRYWTGLATLTVPATRGGLDRAVADANRRSARPYASRVTANRKRLAKGGRARVAPPGPGTKP